MSSSAHDASGAHGSAVHLPVLVREVLDVLQLETGLTVVDGTVGAGGHSSAIWEKIAPSGQIIGLDRDPMMLTHARHKLASARADLVHASYAQLDSVLATLHVPHVDRILLDLGLSSDQLADDARGFSFRSAGPLDLRFDTSRGIPAHELLQTMELDDLTRLLADYGEEPQARRLAQQLLAWRNRKPIQTGLDLAEAVLAGLGAKHDPTAGHHPATRVFQALRIAVNAELQQLEQALAGVLARCLKPDGILAIITFQSLEDRLVKQALRDPHTWQLLTPKPITPRPAEQRFNPRSRTAKLRAARKLGHPTPG